MCTVLLPPGDNPIAVNKYISYHVPCNWTFHNQDTLIWYPRVQRQTFREWVGRFSKPQVCQLFDQLGTLTKKHSFPPNTNFYMFRYVNVLCPSELSKSVPRKKRERERWECQLSLQYKHFPHYLQSPSDLPTTQKTH